MTRSRHDGRSDPDLSMTTAGITTGDARDAVDMTARGDRAPFLALHVVADRQAAATLRATAGEDLPSVVARHA